MKVTDAMIEAGARAIRDLTSDPTRVSANLSDYTPRELAKVTIEAAVADDSFLSMITGLTC